VHSVGAVLGVPIFQGGALVGNYEAAVARQQELIAQYQRTILVALQAVSDALSAYEQNAAQVQGNRERVSVAAEYLMLANLRFRSGVVSYSRCWTRGAELKKSDAGCIIVVSSVAGRSAIRTAVPIQ